MLALPLPLMHPNYVIGQANGQKWQRPLDDLWRSLFFRQVAFVDHRAYSAHCNLRFQLFRRFRSLSLSSYGYFFGGGISVLVFDSLFHC